MREVEQKRKEQLLEDEERKALHFKDAKQKQHEQLELQKSAFEVEMQMERQAFIFQKEKNAYNDRRKQNLDNASAQAAEDKGSELFRRELLLTQTGYDRSIHSAARRASDTINEKKAIGIRTVLEKAMMVQKKEIAATRRMEVAGMAAAGMTAAMMTTMATMTTTTVMMITMMEEGEREDQKPLE